MPKGAPLTAKGALTHTREYVRAYDEAMASHSTSDDVIRAMLARYPGMPHESALIIGTFLNFGEIERIKEYLSTWSDPGGAKLQLSLMQITFQRGEDVNVQRLQQPRHACRHIGQRQM